MIPCLLKMCPFPCPPTRGALKICKKTKPLLRQHLTNLVLRARSAHQSLSHQASGRYWFHHVQVELFIDPMLCFNRRMDGLLLDWLLWCLVGGAFGFWRAWRRTAGSHRRAKEILEDVPKHHPEVASVRGHIYGLRLAGLMIGTLMWATIAGVISGALILILYLAN